MTSIPEPLDRTAAEHDAGARTHLHWYEAAAAIKQVWHEVGRDNLGLVAAGIAFYAMLALFPALAAAVSLYGLAADPATLADHLSRLSALLPLEAWLLIQEQLIKIITASSASLGVGALIGLAFAIWSASRALTALITALNIVYGVAETRRWYWVLARALALTIGAVVFLVVALLLVVALPAVFSLIGQRDSAQAALSFVRWPLVMGALLLGAAALYRFAPNLPYAEKRWIAPGAGMAMVAFFVISAAFSRYVANFGNYNEIYGSVGAVVALLMWLYLTAYAVLVGGELNAELDRQTGRGVPKTPGAVLSDVPHDTHLAPPPGGARTHAIAVARGVSGTSRALLGVLGTLAWMHLKDSPLRRRRKR